MLRPFLYYLFLLSGLSLSGALFAQDVGNVLGRLGKLKEQQLSITGGINLNGQWYQANGIEARRDNFQWRGSANLNLSFLGVNAPFSFVFSDANNNFNLPAYSFAGISPRYKWATLHAGDRSLSFSRYTLGGISFRGVGLQLEPGKFQVATFYGKLNRALAADLNAVGNLNGLFERTGHGLRIGYGGRKTAIFTNYFSATDDNTGLPPISELGSSLSPTANKVVSLEGRQMLGKRVSLTGELAHSVFNGNQNANRLGDQDRNFGNTLFGLFTPNEATFTGQAYNFGANYNANNFGLQGRYERITRGFRTLGSLFFNNDTENITLGANRTFLKGKLNLFVNGGLERTNLDAQELEVTDRLIGSLNVNYRPSDQWMYSASYSNFRNDTKLRAQTDITAPVDSIFLAQVNQNANLTILRQLGTEQRPASLRLMAMHQRANSVINDEVNEMANSRVNILALNYAAGVADQGWQWNAGLTFNQTAVGTINNRSLSPTLGLNRNFLNNSLATYLQTALGFFQQAGDSNQVFNLSFGGNYRLRSSHRLGLRITHLNRFGSELATRNFSEWYTALNYGFNFGGAIGKKQTNPATKTPSAPASAPTNTTNKQ